jgi:hypothetical protein
MRGLKSWYKGGNSVGKPGYWLEFDYDPDIIKQLKESIPSHLREWDAEKKRWWVSELCEVPINKIFPGFIEAVVAQKPLFPVESIENPEELWG